MTLNDLERVIAFNLRFFSLNWIALLANYVTMVEDVRKILSPSYSIPLFVTSYPPCSAVFLR